MEGFRVPSNASSAPQLPVSDCEVVDAPLGLDDPQPILVWRLGCVLLAPASVYESTIAVFVSEQDALSAGSLLYRRYPSKYGPPRPFRAALDDVLSNARLDGDTVTLFDGQMREIEVYR